MQFTTEQQQYIDEHYQLLPVDADGVPIHGGDLLECHANGYDGVFTVFAIGNDVVVGDHDIEWIRSNPDKWFHVALFCTHSHALTVEDVLKEFYDALGWDEADNCALRRDEIIADFADKLREVMADE